jgi:hypothetical protein
VTGLLALLVVALCVLGSAVVCMSIIIHDSKDSSRPAQRRHDQEYAPVGNVYVVLQTNNYTTYEEHTHQDNRQIHIHDEQRAALGTGRTEIEQGQYRSLPRRRQALNAPR